MKSRPHLRSIFQGFTVSMQQQTTVPNPQSRKYKTDFTHPAHPPIGHIISEMETKRRAPGILDRIQTCESREAASLMFHEFLDGANAVSQKTINKANRLLSTLDFPLP